MAAKTIDAGQLKHIFLAGAQRLEANKEWINELNVFPVPDGDTGTNMTLTIMSAVNEVQALENPDMESLAKAISSGSLRKRKLRRYSLPASSGLYQGDQEGFSAECRGGRGGFPEGV